MKIIILPGNSIKNKEWAENLKESISERNDTDNILIQNYSHWEEKREVMGLEKEKEKLLETISAIKNNDYIIIAKSAGTLLCMSVINLVGNKPKKIVLLGIPLRWAKENGFNIEDVSKICYPTTVIQNKEDPVALISDTEEFLREYKIFEKIDFKETLGNTHNYDENEGVFEIINEIIKNI